METTLIEDTRALARDQKLIDAREVPADVRPNRRYATSYVAIRAPNRCHTPRAHRTDLAKSFRILSPQTHFRPRIYTICAHK